MNIDKLIMSQPNAHIMANTWRLIFEKDSESPTNASTPQPIPDFTVLEQLLPEYRLIGLTLANNQERRPD